MGNERAGCKSAMYQEVYCEGGCVLDGDYYRDNFWDIQEKFLRVVMGKSTLEEEMRK